jgi:hypothetical protein
MEKGWSFLKISNKAFSPVGDGKPPRSQISYGMQIVTGKNALVSPIGFMGITSTITWRNSMN